MGLIISMAKNEAQKVVAVNNKLTELCEGIVEKEGFVIFIPLAGKLKEVLSILQQNNLTYHLKNDTIDA